MYRSRTSNGQGGAARDASQEAILRLRSFMFPWQGIMTCTGDPPVTGRAALLLHYRCANAPHRQSDRSQRTPSSEAARVADPRKRKMEATDTGFEPVTQSLEDSCSKLLKRPQLGHALDYGAQKNDTHGGNRTLSSGFEVRNATIDTTWVFKKEVYERALQLRTA